VSVVVGLSVYGVEQRRYTKRSVSGGQALTHEG